ncbi:OmpA family protein [Limoniibacter endophyticus]|uniref:OmpA-like domain-containing protein n=1 Tax=Limoniibacter endophyticus TaxID=1565040 RepID=A0A8J3DDS3_9HYPH|nr:OmpA family protein [Limoniibacter endophyticus]GHC61061.1 hypothetical protein GCM10010136_01430 [Limoniibacter endophyticus]
MTIKSRLFASVAVPFMSLPLVLQPAGAMPNVTPSVNHVREGVILAQQPLLPREGQPEEEEAQPREGERAPEPESETESAPGQQREAPAPEAAPESEPNSEQQEAPAAEPEQPESSGREAPPEPAEETPSSESQEQESQPAEEPEASPAPEQQPAPEPEVQQSEEPATPPVPESETQTLRPERDDAQETAPALEGGEEQRQDGEDEAPRMERDGAASPESQPETSTPDAPAMSPETPESPADADAPTPVSPTETAPTIDQQAAPQPPTTPQDIERAEEIAKDPASAPDDQPMVLPVENGAAVLDSAKEEAPQTQGESRQGEPGPATPPAQAEGEIVVPQSDAEAQIQPQDSAPVRIEAATAERGERLERRPEFERPRGWEEWDSDGRDGRDRDDSRIIFQIDNRTVIRHDDSRRFYGGENVEPIYERLRGGRTREIVERRDGTQVVTIRNRYGEVIQRSRIVPGGEEYVLFYAVDRGDEGEDYVWRDPGLDLPPMRLTVPLDEYIIDTSSDEDRDYYEFLELPPVERVERVYSLDEVRYSARIRDKVRRIDLDTITFDTGSAEISMDQARSLRKVAEAINKVLKDNPAETFLIEGHTDAVGSDESNLVLSDQRAESVASVLTDAFGIPPENMATQGYGERYLKVRTEGPSQENRRVTIRRITPLVRPVASNE